MDRTEHPLAAWLGPALDELTDEQLERLAAESARIDMRYPETDDEDLRQAALSAAVQIMLGDTTPEETARELQAARLAALRASAAARQIAVMLVGDGMAKATAARAAGVDRMTLLADLGER